MKNFLFKSWSKDNNFFIEEITILAEKKFNNLNGQKDIILTQIALLEARS